MRYGLLTGIFDECDEERMWLNTFCRALAVVTKPPPLVIIRSSCKDDVDRLTQLLHYVVYDTLAGR